MKKILLLSFIFCALTTHSQTADEIIAKVSEKAGGLAKYKALKTARMSCTITIQQNEFPITISIINGRAVLSIADVMGEEVITAYKDGKGWKKNQFAGFPEPTEVSGSELAEIKSQSNIAGNLMDYKALGNTVTLKGEEEVNGVKTYIIEVLNKDDGKPVTYNISKADYGLVRSASEREFMGQKAVVETYYAEPLVVEGVRFYTSRSQKVEGQEIQSLKVDKVEVNIPLDEKDFDKP